MDDNKKSILKLLEDGKITADDAVRLIEALDKSGKSKDKTSLCDIADTMGSYVKERAPIVKDKAMDMASKAGNMLGDFLSSVKERKNTAHSSDYVKNVHIVEPDDGFDTVGEAPEGMGAKIREKAADMMTTAECAASEVKDRIKAAKASVESHSEDISKCKDSAKETIDKSMETVNEVIGDALEPTPDTINTKEPDKSND